MIAVETKMVKRLISDPVLEHSEYLRAATNVFVPKRDRKIRCTTEFRKLNSHTVSDKYRMEKVKEILDWLASKRIFTTFDLKNGYFQVELDESSR